MRVTKVARLQSPTAGSNGKLCLVVGSEERYFEASAFVEELRQLEGQRWKLRDEHVGGIIPKGLWAGYPLDGVGIRAPLQRVVLAKVLAFAARN